MKKIVYAAVLATAFAAGCVVEENPIIIEENPIIIADISLDSAGPGTITYQTGDGLRVNARLSGTQSGFQDIYPPQTRALATPELTSGYGTYDIWIDYINDARGSVVVVDATNVVTVNVQEDLHVTADLLLGNGFLMTNWTLNNNMGQIITSCTDPQLTSLGADGVSVLATVAGTSTVFDDIFNCEDGFNNPNPAITSPSPIGPYVVSVSLIDNSTPNPLAIGFAANETPTIVDGNDYQTLNMDGIVDIFLN